MLSALKKLFLISRPISWPNTAYPFAAGYLVTGGQLDLFLIVGTLFFLIPYNLLMYGVNDVFDYESDMQNPRKGGIEGAREQKDFHPVILTAAIVSTAPFAIWLFLQGTLVQNIVLLLLLFFVVAYSVGGLRFKEIPILDSITSSIHFVGPLIYALSITGFSLEQLPYVVAFFLWGVASHAFGAVQDIIPDRKGKLASIATVFGARHTVRGVFVLYLASAIIVISQGFPVAIIGLIGLAYAVNVSLYLYITDVTSADSNKGWRHFIWLNLFTGFAITMLLIFINY